MTPQRRQVLYLCVLVALLFLADIWCYGQFTDSRSRALQAEQTTTHCLRIGQAIAQRGGLPTVAASSDVLTPDALIQQIKHAAEAAELAITMIEPQPPRRVESLNEQSIAVELEAVDLKQLVTLLHQITTDVKGVRVCDLQLSSLPDPQGNPTWQAQVILSYHTSINKGLP